MFKKYVLWVFVIPIGISVTIFSADLYVYVDKLTVFNFGSDKQEINKLNAQKKIAFQMGFEACSGANDILWSDTDNDGMAFVSKMDSLEGEARALGFADKTMFDTIRYAKTQKIDKLTEYNRMRAQLEAHLKMTPELHSAYIAGQSLEILARTAFDERPGYGTLEFYHEELQNSVKAAGLDAKVFGLPPEKEINYNQLASAYVKLFLDIKKQG